MSSNDWHKKGIASGHIASTLLSQIQGMPLWRRLFTNQHVRPLSFFTWRSRVCEFELFRKGCLLEEEPHATELRELCRAPETGGHHLRQSFAVDVMK
jgi:hypothetical protein